jgi:hypothetical protein
VNDALRQRVEAVKWLYAIELGDGLVTPGRAGADTIPLDTLPAFEG